MKCKICTNEVDKKIHLTLCLKCENQIIDVLDSEYDIDEQKEEQFNLNRKYKGD